VTLQPLMVAVLAVAAKECQIVIFTCVPKDMRLLGRLLLFYCSMCYIGKVITSRIQAFAAKQGDFLKVLGEWKESDGVTTSSALLRLNNSCDTRETEWEIKKPQPAGEISAIFDRL